MSWLPIAKTLTVGGAFAAAIGLSGCAMNALTPGGTPSGMDSVNTRLRSGLTVTPSPLSRPPTYTPAQPCTYRQVVTLVGQRPAVKSYSVGVKAVRDRLLVSFVGSGETSTALINRQGTMFDFNLVNSIDGSRWTSDNYRARATQQAARTQAQYGPSAHSINDFTALYPRFILGRQQVGDVVAEVQDESGKVWASYIYRGVVQYNGNQAIVLDLMRRFESVPGNPILMVGFNVLDSSTMAPLVFVLDAGHKLKFERISCP